MAFNSWNRRLHQTLESQHYLMQLQKQGRSMNYPFATIDPNVGVVKYPGPSFTKNLTELVKPRENCPNDIWNLLDIAGIVKRASRGKVLGNKFLSQHPSSRCDLPKWFVVLKTKILHTLGKLTQSLTSQPSS